MPLIGLYFFNPLQNVTSQQAFVGFLYPWNPKKWQCQSKRHQEKWFLSQRTQVCRYYGRWRCNNGRCNHIAQWKADPDGTLGVLFKPLWESSADDDMLEPVDCWIKTREAIKLQKRDTQYNKRNRFSRPSLRAIDTWLPGVVSQIQRRPDVQRPLRRDTGVELRGSWAR